MESVFFFLSLGAHLIFLLLGMGSVLVVDVFGFLWLLRRIDISFLLRITRVTQWLIWIGWTGLVLSGISLIIFKGYFDNLTLMKLFFVVLVGANGIFLHVINKSLIISHRGNHISTRLKFRIGLATIISQIGWWSAITIGFLHRHWQHRIDWPYAPELYMAGVVFAILFIATVGELLLSKRTRHRN